VAAAEEREESKQVEQEGDHRAGIVSGSEPTDQPLGRRTGFWRRTGLPERDDVDDAARFGSERHDLGGDGYRSTPENAACSLRHGRATTLSLGRCRLWPDLPRPRMAGFEVSAEGKLWGRSPGILAERALIPHGPVSGRPVVGPRNADDAGQRGTERGDHQDSCEVLSTNG
jgi:hypothetical protein